MRIDSAILTNAIITASTENPIVSGSSQVNITQTTGYSTFSSSIQTYTNAKVNALVNAAPGALDTLDELAAALGDDANLSASIEKSSACNSLKVKKIITMVKNFFIFLKRIIIHLLYVTGLPRASKLQRLMAQTRLVIAELVLLMQMTQKAFEKRIIKSQQINT